MGDRLKKVDNGSGEITTFPYDATDQLVTSEDSAGTTNYVYDGAGNLGAATDPSGSTTTNTWDDDNRRTLAELPTGVVNACLRTLHLETF